MIIFEPEWSAGIEERYIDQALDKTISNSAPSSWEANRNGHQNWALAYFSTVRTEIILFCIALDWDSTGFCPVWLTDLCLQIYYRYGLLNRGNNTLVSLSQIFSNCYRHNTVNHGQFDTNFWAI